MSTGPYNQARQAVRDALAHRKPSHVPIDFGSTAVTGIHVSVVAALREYYGLEIRPVKICEPYQMLGLIEDDLAKAINIDTKAVFTPKTIFGFPLENWKPWQMPDGLEVLVPGDFNTTVDSNGDFLIYPQGDTSVPASGRMPKGGYFFDAIVRQPPINEEQLNWEDNTEEFQPISDQDLLAMRVAVDQASTTGRALVLSLPNMYLGDIALVPAPFLKHPKGIRDIAEWYMSLRARPDYIHKIFERETAVALTNLEKIHAAIGNNVEAVFTCGTDFGTQTSSFCSVQTFRTLWLPYYKAMNDWIHQHTTWRVLKHSCGAVEKFIDSFIEAGFDILNPVQCSATGMDPKLLKAKYGDRITFWGGGVDTQKTLPFGTPQEVHDQVLHRCEIFSRQGGFVFTTIHNVQARTPLKNFVALLDAVREFNGATNGRPEPTL
ncbi:MAG: methyltransferase [Verrucomicrobia bacterium]|nr:methyltransferase [Verrucomicrobiota bacterium]